MNDSSLNLPIAFPPTVAATPASSPPLPLADCGRRCNFPPTGARRRPFCRLTKRPFSGVDNDGREWLGSSAAAWNLDSRLHLADSPNIQGVPGPGSTSRTNTASTSRAALAIADTATLYEQRSSSNDPPVLEYSRQQELKAQIRSSRAFPDAPQVRTGSQSKSPNSGGTTASTTIITG
ncbi:hypothetical protein BJV77DRAFT_1070122 [Russula vinacea]|nr:hypothetical protein BJV77DRAFT_1070122 [Russula vinacea]